MLKKISLVLFVFSLQIIFSQTPTKFQDELLKAFKKDSLNYNFIEHLSVIDTLVTKEDIASNQQLLDDLITDLPQKEENQKRERKRIKKVYDFVHKAFFKKYEEEAFFPSIFKNGVYNCVTATAIYAYIFDEIKVPYSIKEYPGHVFLIAYPNTLKIHLETTTPGDYGFSSPKDSEVHEIVKDLMKMKLVTKEEVNEKGESKVYMDYFYGEEFVDKKALVGMQYYNLAVKYYEEENYAIALDNIEKSLIYFPYPSSKYLKNVLIFLNLSKMEFRAFEEVEMFFSTFSKIEYKEDYNLQDINFYLYKIAENNEVESLVKLVDMFEVFPDEEVKKEARVFLFRNIADEYARDELLDNALEYSKKLLVLDEKNKRAKDIITYVIGKKITLLPVSEDTLKTIDNYIADYPQLKDNIRVDSFRTHILIKLIQDTFQRKEIKKGEEYLNALNKILHLHKSNLLVNREYISYGFFYSGKYYYQHNKFKKALDKLNRGLEFSPKNKEILKYLKWVKEEMN